MIGAVVGEFVGAQAGLGYLITTLNFNLDVPGVFAVLILLSLLGIMLHDVVRRIGRRLVFWIRSERTERGLPITALGSLITARISGRDNPREA